MEDAWIMFDKMPSGKYMWSLAMPYLEAVTGMSIVRKL
jgi:hypothetical protein